ncbi:MarR family winged helix-turn-helix transcriptional regulator, partial [Chloroflexota bacterium]
AIGKRVYRSIDVDHEDVALRAFTLFVQTARAVMKYTDTHLYRKARVSIIRLIALQALASNGGIMKPSEIAEWTQTERHNITTLVNRMRKEGLVTADRNTSDKRSVDITLTDKGREVLSQAMLVAKEVVDQVMSSLSEGNATLLEKTLRVLRQNAHYGLESASKHPQPPPE